MNRQIVILVHGMGTHGKGDLTGQFKAALKERAASFGVADDSFLDEVDYKEFNYSSFFDAIRKQFSENAQARKKGFGFLVGQGFEEKLIQQLTTFESNFGKDEFFYTHWLDVILYATMYFGEKLRIDFIDFFEKIRRKSNQESNHQSMHIICHSLGSAVVHDALAKFYREDSLPFDKIPDLKTGNFNIASLWTIANVSRMVNLLNGLADPLSSTVTTGTKGCAKRFINVRHKFDPFTWFKPYDRSMANCLTLETSVIRKFNPDTHDFFEYVTAPEVARELLRSLFGKEINDADYNEGVEAHKKDSLGAEVTGIVNDIESAKKDASIESIKAALARFKEIQTRIAQLSKEVESQ